MDSNSLENATARTGAGKGHRARQKKFAQHDGSATGDLEGNVEKERRGGKRHKTEGETGHVNIPGEKKMSREE